MARKAVFLDRDGTLIEDQHFAFHPDRITFTQGATVAVGALAGAGYELVIVTNQSGVARGLFDEQAVRAMHQRLEQLLAQHDIRLGGSYYCPHHPEGAVARYRVDCNCRKPRPGLLLRAARELDLDLGSSWLVGDIWEDALAGDAVGCRTILVGDTVREPMPASLVGKAIRADNLAHAARLILECSRGTHAV